MEHRCGHRPRSRARGPDRQRVRPRLTRDFLDRSRNHRRPGNDGIGGHHALDGSDDYTSSHHDGRAGHDDNGAGPDLDLDDRGPGYDNGCAGYDGVHL